MVVRKATGPDESRLVNQVLKNVMVTNDSPLKSWPFEHTKNGDFETALSLSKCGSNNR